MRDSQMIDVSATTMFSRVEPSDKGPVRRFYNLDLEYERVNLLSTSWTIVHPITPESPLAGMGLEDLHTRRAELLLIVKGIDEGYMQPVITRHSFRYDEIAWGGRFVKAYGVRDGVARLELSKISDYTPEPAPERLPS